MTPPVKEKSQSPAPEIAKTEPKKPAELPSEPVKPPAPAPAEVSAPSPATGAKAAKPEPPPATEPAKPAMVATNATEAPHPAANSPLLLPENEDGKKVAVNNDPLRFVPEPLKEFAPDSKEGSALVKDALARIDEAPADLYSDKAKVKVREGLKGARRIFKVDTIHFDKGGDVILPAYKTHITKALQDTALTDATNDPRAVFFILGFADKSGNADTNKKLSLTRANTVINLLRNDCGVINLTYPVAIGPTEIVAPENKDKNRAAEVWLVLP
jgi:outer membrane protein OmpA-like peptidoglycan-associated protein